MREKTGTVRYWLDRSDMMYYNYVFYVARTVAAEGSSILDVGSNRCSYLDWFYWMDRKVSLDQVTPYRAPGIESIKADFFQWQPPEQFDLVLCLQVLEHIPDVQAFSRKLLECGKHVIISVPFQWPEGSPYHIHDPVTHDDVTEWFGRKPNMSAVVRELFISNGKNRRLVAYFDTVDPSRRVTRDDRLRRRTVLPPEMYEEQGIVLDRPLAVEAFEQRQPTADRSDNSLDISSGDSSLREPSSEHPRRSKPRTRKQAASDPSTRDQFESTWAVVDAALTDYKEIDLSWIQPTPSDDGWTLAPDALRFITNLVKQLEPQHIVEFGSGLSTRVFARASGQSRWPVAITSIDNDSRFSELARQAVFQDDCAGPVLFQVAPLVLRREVRARYQTLPVFDIQRERFASQYPADLILIDGPPQRLGGREGVLYQALKFSRPGTLILLDDAARPEESEIIERWRAQLAGDIHVRLLPGFVKGLAAIMVM